jgi:hypothetical protein
MLFFGFRGLVLLCSEKTIAPYIKRLHGFGWSEVFIRPFWWSEALRDLCGGLLRNSLV